MHIANTPLALTNVFLDRLPMSPPTSSANVSDVSARPRHGLVRDTRQIDGIAEALSAAYAHGLAQGWALAPCAPEAARRPRENHVASECSARVRVHEANRRSHDRARMSGGHREAQPDVAVDHQRSPWRACETVNARSHEPMHLANGILTVLGERDDGTRPAHLLQQDGEGAFLLQVARVPEANVALVLTERGEPVEPRTVLQRHPDGWRSLGDLSLPRDRVAADLAADGTEAPSRIVRGPVECSPYRLHAVRPEPEDPSAQTVIHAGAGVFIGNATRWRRVPLTSAAIIDALLEQRRNESADRPCTLDEVLATVRDEQVLQIGENRFYVPMRDAAGRFWLPVKKSEDEAVRIVDRRSTRCLHGAVFLRRHAEQEWAQQRDVPPPSRQCHANGTLIAAGGDDAAASKTPVRVGADAASGYRQFRYGMFGPVRRSIEAAFDAISRKAMRAAEALDTRANAEYALAQFLRFLPERLHASFIERIERKINRVRTDILLLRNSWDNVKLVDEIEGGAAYCAQNGHIYVTPALPHQSPEVFARFLLSTIIGQKAGQTDLFRPLSSVDAALERAGRFVSYDVTLLQSALTWPDRAHIASELTYIYEAQEDRAHPLEAIGFPRSDSLLSADQLDNLAILLRDNESLMSLIDALDAEWPATATPAPARLIRCPLPS